MHLIQKSVLALHLTLLASLIGFLSGRIYRQRYTISLRLAMIVLLLLMLSLDTYIVLAYSNS